MCILCLGTVPNLPVTKIQFQSNNKKKNNAWQESSLRMDRKKQFLYLPSFAYNNNNSHAIASVSNDHRSFENQQTNAKKKLMLTFNRRILWKNSAGKFKLEQNWAIFPLMKLFSESNCYWIQFQEWMQKNDIEKQD